MSVSIELTPAQARAVAELAEREGTMSLRQLVALEQPSSGDVYATPEGSTRGYRITADGQISGIETLPGE